ncbi:hypothetical protein AVEN_254961-1, partial [Araneus ventricosus]
TSISVVIQRSHGNICFRSELLVEFKLFAAVSAKDLREGALSFCDEFPCDVYRRDLLAFILELGVFVSDGIHEELGPSALPNIQGGTFKRIFSPAPLRSHTSSPRSGIQTLAAAGHPPLTPVKSLPNLKTHIAQEATFHVYG